jgi:CRP-like cAMP-binding protein
MAMEIPLQRQRKERNFMLPRIFLFEGIQDLEEAVRRLEGREAIYQKGQTVLPAGETPSALGIVLSGHIKVLRRNEAGRESIFHFLKKGAVFAESLMLTDAVSPVTLTAIDETRVLFLRFSKVFEENLPFGSLLTRNLLKILAQKNLMLTHKMDLLSLKTLREKIGGFLLSEYEEQRSPVLHVAFDRESLAEYLGADRSALSRELSKMRREGLIDYYKNVFKIKDVKALSSDEWW